VWLGPEVRVPEDLAGRRVFKNSDPHLPAPPPITRRNLSLRVSGAIGEKPTFFARCGDVEARVTGETPLEEARSAPVDEAVLRDKLGRLGDTPFTLQDFSAHWPAGAMVPLSSLNRARRALVEQLLAAADRRHTLTSATHRDLQREIDRPPPPPGLFVLCRNLAQAEAAVAAGADGVYIDFLELTGTGEAVRKLRGRTIVGVAPPRIRKPGEDKIDRYLGTLEADAVLVRGLGALRESSPGLRVGDFSLNVTNRLSAAEVLARAGVFTPSFDLDSAQLLSLLKDDLAPFAEVVVHHPMPLFHMEHCVIAALLGDGADYRTCGRPCDRHQLSLRDRAGMDHPVEADVGCRNTVFHAAAQSAADLVPRLSRVRRFRIELVRETAAEVGTLVETYRALIAGRATAKEVWRRLKVDSGYGVVRGSLRVVSPSSIL
jgi:putative protease